jgi:hypothetical protein
MENTDIKNMTMENKTEGETIVETIPLVVEDVKEEIKTNKKLEEPKEIPEAVKKAIANKNKGLCRHLLDGSLVCTHSVCYYAHRLEDWIHPVCRYREECKWITYNKGGFPMNTRKNFCCGRLHPGEQEDRLNVFYRRVGLDSVSGLVVIHKPKEVPLPMEKKDEVKNVRQNTSKPRNNKLSRKHDESVMESTIEIPKMLALEALKLIVASGRSNIKVEFK